MLCIINHNSPSFPNHTAILITYIERKNKAVIRLCEAIPKDIKIDKLKAY
ncbi:hypothetical protein TUM4433_16170 [Shewanella schlegeliana]|nr:hypothetical protein TUM4433_16170 [Shewanella schlegeliana]